MCLVANSVCVLEMPHCMSECAVECGWRGGGQGKAQLVGNLGNEKIRMARALAQVSA